MSQARISDIISTEYADFISYCASAGKTFVSDLTNIDYVAFRSSSNRSRDYIDEIKGMLESANADEPKAEMAREESPCDREDDDKEYLHEKNRLDEANDSQADQLSSNIEWNKNLENTIGQLLDLDASTYDDVRIEVLDLSRRSYGHLKKEHIHTIAQLLSVQIKKIYLLSGMGKKSVSEIIQKVKEYVSNLEKRNFIDEKDNSRNEEKAWLTPEYKKIIGSFLEGENISVENFNEEQLAYFEKLKMAEEIVGKEICVKAYSNPNYMVVICRFLLKFAAPYLRYDQLMHCIDDKLNEMKESLKSYKIMPFIEAHDAKASKKYQSLKKVCDSETTFAQLSRLVKKSEKDEGLVTETKKFLEWMEFDVREIASSILDGMYKNIGANPDRTKEVFELRVNDESLESIGSRYDITREAIRQIERKAHGKFWDAYERQEYDIIMLVCALQNGNSIIYRENLEENLGKEFTKTFLHCLKQAKERKNYFYYSPQYPVVMKGQRTMDEIKNSFDLAVKDIDGLPMIIEESQETILLKLKEIADRNEISLEFVKDIFFEKYEKGDRLCCRKGITVIAKCEYILKNYYQAGYKIADEFEAEVFNHHMTDSFGSAARMSPKAIDAKVTEIGVLCDRGKYIHPDHLQVDSDVMQALNDLIENSSNLVMSYAQIFSDASDLLKGTQITNKYILQGALKKYGCRYKTDRNYVKKSDSVNMLDEIEAFIEERGVVHKSEIFAEYPQMAEANLSQTIARSKKVFNIDDGQYIHANQFDIRPEDYEIRSYLVEVGRDIPVSIESIGDALIERYPDFIDRNEDEFADKNKLFAALQYMFLDEFTFSRPFILAKPNVKGITVSSVILQHMESYDDIEIEELVDICDENHIKYLSQSRLLDNLIAPQFARVSRTMLMRWELTGITDEIIDFAVADILKHLEADDYLVSAKITEKIDFILYPQIDVEWNEFLLESLIVRSEKVNKIYAQDGERVIYVSDKYKECDFKTFLIKVLKEEVDKGSFATKNDMRDWLQEKGLLGKKFPAYLQSAQYFYVDKTGVHYTGEE